MLVSTSKAANILGISLQGVHYRIKKGLLKSKKEDGKILVYIENEQVKENKTSHNNNIEDIIKVKDEQIALLNDSIVWMKSQYESEIQRLQNSNDKVIDVFKSEITLLQQAYNEMKNLSIENKSTNTNIIEEHNIEFISVKDFFLFMKRHDKTDTQVKNIILNQIKKDDNRFIYNSKTKELIIHKSDFTDII